MDSEEFTNIRNILGKTQEQLAELLCVSAKAVQSYEQGWRNSPVHVEKQMLMLLALKKTTQRTSKACWEIKDCPPEWRSKCIVWELKIRHFCWFLNGTYCQGKINNRWDDKIKLCRKCEVYKAILPSS